MAMTKKEFAARLLFWLLPWPISKVLPRSLRIYYFGPAGGPPPGFYDYWGRPSDYWDDMYTPPPPDQFPDVPDGPINPGDPYTPGPGGSDPSPPPPWIWTQHLDDADWELEDPLKGTWDNANQEWDSYLEGGVQQRVRIVDIGLWALDYRPNYLRVTWVGGGTKDVFLNNENGDLINAENEDHLALSSGHLIHLSAWGGFDILGLRVQAVGADTAVAFSVTNIEFTVLE
jgi:hypothetical protein